jgi:hypothetical protein
MSLLPDKNWAEVQLLCIEPKSIKGYSSNVLLFVAVKTIFPPAVCKNWPNKVSRMRHALECGMHYTNRTLVFTMWNRHLTSRYRLEVAAGVLYYTKLSHLADFFLHNLQLCQLYEKGWGLSSSLAQRKPSSKGQLKRRTCPMLVHFHFINLARQSLLRTFEFVRFSPFGLMMMKTILIFYIFFRAYFSLSNR